MPFRTTPPYGMISFDANGKEYDDPDGVMSDRLEALAASGAFTNIFLFAHGWKGDVDKAFDQFDRWIGALESHHDDRAHARRVFPRFNPLYIGIHWPSLSGGDESLLGTSYKPIDPQEYIKAFGGSAAVETAVTAIDNYESERKDLTDEIRQHGQTLVRELGLSDKDIDGEIFPKVEEPEDYGSVRKFLFSGVLSNFTYWTMKKRARSIGEGAGHEFLKRLQRATAAKRTPIHLMGHSFGCVVMSSILGGPGAASPLERPVDSVALIQGAVSLWSYASKLPSGQGTGYFHRVALDGKVRGPLIATRSELDSAVNIPYKAASAVVRDQAFALGPAKDDASDYYKLDPPPKYGAIGRFGLRGLPVNDLLMKDENEPYSFECGQIYNLDSNQFICRDDGIGIGAHNHIDSAAVAHAIWAAAFASAR